MSSQQNAAPPAAQYPVVSSNWRGELSGLFRLGWPLIVAQLAQSALFTTDVIMTGWLGPSYLAAASIATAYLNTFLLAGFGLVGAVAPMVAQARGAGDIKSVRRTVRQGLWVAIALSAIFIPILLQVRTAFAMLGQNASVTELAAGYMQVAAFVFLPGLCIIVIRSFLAAHGKTRPVLIVTLFGVLINAAANYGFMFGNWGLPRLELVGAGIATLITNIFMVLALLGYVQWHQKFRRYHVLARFWKPDWPRFRAIFRIGTPIGLTLMAEIALFSAAAVLMGWLGTNEQAAHAVALQCASLAFMVPLGLSQATTVRVGLAYGAGSNQGIRLAGWTSLAATMVFMSMTAISFILTPQTFVGLFLSPHDPANATALGLAAIYLGVAGLFQLVDGGQVIASAALRGLSDTKMPMIIALLGYWAVGFPVAYVLGFVLEWRGIGIWLGLAAGLASVAIVLTARFALRERLGLIKPRSALQSSLAQ